MLANIELFVAKTLQSDYKTLKRVIIKIRQNGFIVESSVEFLIKILEQNSFLIEEYP